MGTFIIRPTGQDSQTGTGFILVGSDSVVAVNADDANYIEGFSLNATKNGQIRYNFSGASIYLDGSSTPIPFSSLPSGWLPLTVTLTADGTFSVFVKTQIICGAQDGLETVSIYLQFDIPTEQVFTTHTFQDGPFNFPLAIASSLSALDLINNGCGVRWTLIAPVGHTAEFIINRLYISGTYGINQFTFTLSDNGTSIGAGDSITITSPNGGLLGVIQNVGTGYSNLRTQYTDPTTGLLVTINIPSINITTLTPYILTFVPIPLPPSAQPPNGVILYFPIPGDGIQFTGSVISGTRTFIIANPSGIYQITKNKRNDTIYYRNGNIIVTDPSNILELDDDGQEISIINPALITTMGPPNDEDIYDEIPINIYYLTNVIPGVINTKIPDPFVKLGFIGG